MLEGPEDEPEDLLLEDPPFPLPWCQPLSPPVTSRTRTSNNLLLDGYVLHKIPSIAIKSMHSECSKPHFNGWHYHMAD